MSEESDGPPLVALSGTAQGGFAPLADVFARLATTLDGAGAALCVYEHGQAVVDLTAGSYAPDSLQLLFSVTKAVTTTAVGTLVEDGLVDLDRPLVEVWPELDRPEVAGVTLRTVMSHRSGLTGLSGPVSFEELVAGRDRELITQEVPSWPPGTAHGYQAFTFGTLVDGAVRRLVGASVGEVVRDRVAAPLGLDLWIGAPSEVHARVAPMCFRVPMATPLMLEHARAGVVPPDAAIATVRDAPRLFDSPELLGASLPALSGVSDARSLARMMAATLGPVDGHRLFGEAVLADLTATRSRGVDRSFGVPFHYATGYQLPFPQLPMLGPTSYGHEGAGGSVALADPELGLAVGFTTNAFEHLPGASTTALALLPAVRHCATARPDTTDREEQPT